MNKFIYLVHTEIYKDLIYNLDDVEKYVFAFSSVEKAEEYIKTESEVFSDKHKDLNVKTIYFVRENGFCNALYNNGSKTERFKMWYERIPLVE